MRLLIERVEGRRTTRLILKHEPLGRREGERRKRKGACPRGFAQRRGHVCIIRDEPITARNACQAVKRYPGPQPGGLMISLGNLLSCPSSLPSSILALSTAFHCYYPPYYNFIRLYATIRQDLMIVLEESESLVPEYVFIGGFERSDLKLVSISLKVLRKIRYLIRMLGREGFRKKKSRRRDKQCRMTNCI